MVEIKARNFHFIKTGGGSPSAKMRFEVLFSAPPTDAIITLPFLKFDKTSFFSVDWDDGAMRGNRTKDVSGIPTFFPANPIIDFMSSLTFSDGCGNNRPYTAGIAINCGTGLPGDENYNPDFLQSDELRWLINRGWDIENHGFIHNPVPSAIVDVNKLDAQIRLRAKYEMRFTVIPGNSWGYANAASLADHVGITSGGDYYDQYNPVRWYRQFPNAIGHPVFAAINREFIDEWDNTGFTNPFRTLIGQLGTAIKILRVGTHSPMDTSPLSDGFKSVMNYLKSSAGDKILICPTRELLEYFEMCALPYTQTVSGNKLIVEIDTSGLSPKNRWRDMSFKIGSSAAITGVNLIEGIESSTFNPETKLVNIFSQKTTWA